MFDFDIFEEGECWSVFSNVEDRQSPITIDYVGKPECGGLKMLLFISSVR